MSPIIIIAAAVLPAILLWLYIWKKDTQKEPTFWLVKAVLWGVAICIPVAIVEGGLEALLFGVDGKPSSLLGTTILAFVIAYKEKHPDSRCSGKVDITQKDYQRFKNQLYEVMSSYKE